MKAEGREKGEGETEEQAKVWRGRRGRKRVGLIFSTAGWRGLLLAQELPTAGAEGANQKVRK